MTKTKRSALRGDQDSPPKCKDLPGTTLKVKRFSAQDPDSENATLKAIAHISEEIQKELKAKQIKCDAPCDDEGAECYIDIEPPINAQLSDPKPILKYNSASGTYETAWVVKMKKDTTFTISCDCGFVV